MADRTYFSVFTLHEKMFGQLPEGQFVRNDAYATIAELVRDTQFAPERITNFAKQCGFEYRLWTKKATYNYLVTCFAKKDDCVVVTIDVLLNKVHPNAVFDLLIEFWSTKYPNVKFATCRQTIACQTPDLNGHYGDRPTSWRKIPSIKMFVERDMMD